MAVALMFSCVALVNAAPVGDTQSQSANKNVKKPVKKGVKKESTWDKYSIVKYPLSSESAIKTIEDQNTLVFIVDKRARKPAIRKACKELYNITVSKVNTLITPKGNKKAYVVLSKAHDALEIANKIGIM